MHDDVRALLNAADIVSAKNSSLRFAEMAVQTLKERFGESGLYRLDDGTLVDLNHLDEADRQQLMNQIAPAAPKFAADLEELREKLPGIISTALAAAPKAEAVIRRLEQAMLNVIRLGGKATLEDNQPMSDAISDLRFAVAPVTDHPFLDDPDYDIDEFLEDKEFEVVEVLEGPEEDPWDPEDEAVRILSVMADPQSAGHGVDCEELFGSDFFSLFENEEDDSIPEEEWDVIAPHDLTQRQQSALKQVFESFYKLLMSPEGQSRANAKGYRSDPYWDPVRSAARQALKEFEE